MELHELRELRPAFELALRETMVMLRQDPPDVAGAVRASALSWVSLFNNVAMVFHENEQMSESPERLYTATFNEGPTLDVDLVAVLVTPRRTDIVGYTVLALGHQSATLTSYGGTFLAGDIDINHAWDLAVGHMIGVVGALYDLGE